MELWIASNPTDCPLFCGGKPLNLRNYLAGELLERTLAQSDYIVGHRKLVSALLVDMGGLASLAEEPGMEIGPSVYEQLCEIIVRKVCNYEGIVNLVVDQMALALFGAPIPVEDSAQRAIRAAMAIHRDLIGFSDFMRDRTDGPPILLRMGINTGPVVVESIGSDLRIGLTAVENTFRRASEMVALAEPGTTYVSEETFELTEGFFRFEALGKEVVDDRDRSVKAYRVLGRSSTRTRFDVNAERGLTRFVGRDRDIEVLLDAYEKARDGRGQICSIVGEAGVGKSRLLYEFRKALSNEDVTFLEGKCLSYGREAAYLPIIDILKSNFDIRDTDTEFQIRNKVRNELALLGVDEAGVLPYLLELLSVKESGIDEIAMSPEARKEGIVQALRRPLLKGARRRPIIIALEDLHWMDGSSEDILNSLVNDIRNARVLIVSTYRPKYSHGWGAKPFHVQVNLDPLSTGDSLAMVAHLVGTYDIARNLEMLILDKTAGVPFYIEEFVRSLKDLKIVERRGNRYSLCEDRAGLTIASTIQDVIMARVDALPASAKQVLQVGSVIEREFTHRLIARVMDLPEHELVSRLSILRYSDLLYERGVYPDSTYVFKHVLIRDVCYHSLAESTRRGYHRRIAEVIDQHFPEMAEGNPEVSGHHYTEAGLPEPAASFWHRAGEIAVRRSANREAISHLKRALTMLRALPANPESLRRELDVQLALGPALMAVKGYADPAVEKAYGRARELCNGVGEPLELFNVLRGLWGFYIVRGDLQTAHELGRRCLVLAEEDGSPALRLWAHYMLGMTVFHLGELVAALKHFDNGLTIYDMDKRRSPRALQDPGVACLSYKAAALWLLGYPDRGVEISREAVRLAERLSHPFSLVYALSIGGLVSQLCSNVQEVRERAEAAGALCQDHGIRYWSAWGPILRGWAMAQEGRREEGILLQQEGLASYNSTGARLVRTYFLTVLAESHQGSGKTDEALAVINEGLETGERTGERWFEAELHRLKGDTLLEASDDHWPEAQECLKRALETARSQGARSLELRAAVSLFHLFRKRGMLQQGRQILRDIYDQFTEGFNCADLHRAKNLLEEDG